MIPQVPLRLASAAALVLVAACAAPAPRAPSVYYKSSVPHAPFSAAVRSGDLIILSGQIGLGPDGTLPADFSAQVHNTLESVGGVLKQAGAGFDDVVKCTVMLADMSHWEDFNRIYVTYFRPDRLPARSALGANGLARGAQVELECLARVPAGT
ncbi:MAG: RidA family protein [Proteobacteria bacterium]|nr:RidA family protein [Pseudomonadota bacterium]